MGTDEFHEDRKAFADQFAAFACPHSPVITRTPGKRMGTRVGSGDLPRTENGGTGIRMCLSSDSIFLSSIFLPFHSVTRMGTDLSNITFPFVSECRPGGAGRFPGTRPARGRPSRAARPSGAQILATRARLGATGIPRGTSSEHRRA